ncbi:MAG: hypothetical protein ACI9P5_003778 [Saprospiraceae bacterium]|jgi:uncharacterized protein (DUF697 family)|tara:strand:+ start:530 stop:1060 length:531 start_codon:yes stop_codon:yes gene_type:complete
MSNEISGVEKSEIATLLHEESNAIILKAVGKSSSISAIPIPLLDVAVVTYIQVDMVQKLAELHGVVVENKNKLIVSSAISALLSKFISEAVSSLASQSSLTTFLSDSLVKASISGFVTTITGEVYKKHFELGGTLEDISASIYVEYFKEQMSSDRVSVEKITTNIIDSTMSKFGLN